eukprot:CAMPEP_0196656204 /NCGR_PEP_ID=MMETSP1086-20130531/13863_1 /TAXON_ID=77921 /ORGANISM="Cyanoptyche  gloeocystis , Strain SAG4.97" /LENGTH=177 /DNA_ID=CAMNT_0041988847 /DNA_START=86 /DNA_END=619 /DNA_ORIENTATION=-
MATKCILDNNDCQFHDAYKAFESAATLCPAFKFDAAPDQQDEVAIFQKVHHTVKAERKDCPFTASHKVYVETIKTCPSCGKGCPFSELTSTEAFFHMLHHSTWTASDILIKFAERCPSFKDGPISGCPFLSAFKEFKDAIVKCPAFKSGCPFKQLEFSDTTGIKEAAHKVHVGLATA